MIGIVCLLNNNTVLADSCRCAFSSVGLQVQFDWIIFVRVLTIAILLLLLILQLHVPLFNIHTSTNITTATTATNTTTATTTSNATEAD